MNKTITATADRSLDRALSDNELENVSGGHPVLIGLGLAVLFVGGMIAGDMIHAATHGAGGASIPDGVGLGA
jgi:bacteriocin-like protein